MAASRAICEGPRRRPASSSDSPAAPRRLGGDELAKRGGGSGDPFAVARGVLEHDHGIGAGRNGRAGHDLECFAASQLAQADIARPHFALDAQPPWRVFGAAPRNRRGESARAAGSRDRHGGLGEHAAAGGIERNFLDGAGGERGGDAINDALPGLAKVQGGHETILASQPAAGRKPVKWTGMPNHLTLTQMAAAVRERRVSPVELVEAHLGAIERRQPQLNAFRFGVPRGGPGGGQGGGADARGRAAGGRAGYDQGQLRRGGAAHAVRQPVAHGSSGGKGCDGVERLRSAGAIVLGKTNCPEFLYNYETDNYVAGAPTTLGRDQDPGGIERRRGGGDRVAVLAGGPGERRRRVHPRAGALQRDCRAEATPGRISAAGHFPLINHPNGLLGVGGPLARTAEDVRLLFEVAAGYDSRTRFPRPCRCASRI